MTIPLKHTVWTKFVITLCIFSLITTPVTYAINNKYDETFYSQNDIEFYNPEAAAACGATGNVALTGGSIKEKIWNALLAQGLSSEQAAGVMGNMQAESGFIPTRFQGDKNFNPWDSVGGHAWGLSQWDGGRRYAPVNKGILGTLRKNYPQLIKYVDSKYTTQSGLTSIPAADLDAIISYELDYLVQESKARSVTAHGYGSAGNEWDTLKIQKTVNDATVFWHNNFEVSADSAATVIKVRGGFAQSIYTEFSGKSGNTAGNSTTPGGTCAQTPQSNDKFIQTVLAYAQPQYHPPVYINNMPAYAIAVKNAIASGRYVGGVTKAGNHPGVDCGGFVTTLEVDSGHEPKYNSGNGPTGDQMAWLNKNWTWLGTGGSFSTSKLKPGDVAIYSNGSEGHTFVYVGPIKDSSGKEILDSNGKKIFDSIIASASVSFNGSGWRSPMAGHESITDSQFTWYTKK